MKVTISLPDDVYRGADQLADRLGLSRSELYATAVSEYLAKHRHQEVTARLNEVYARGSSEMAPDLREAQANSVDSGEW